MKVKNYLLYHFLVFVAACLFVVIAFNISAPSIDTSGFMGGLALLGPILLFGSIAAITVFVVDIKIAKKFIDSNIQEGTRKEYNKSFVKKIGLIMAVFSVLVYLIYMAIGVLFGSSIGYTPFLGFIQYLFYPLIIPLNILIIKRGIINRATAYRSILAAFVACTIATMFVSLWISVVMGGDSVSMVGAVIGGSLYYIVYIAALFVFAIMPLVNVSLVLLNRDRKAN